MKAHELRDMTVEELSNREGDFRKEMFNLRFQAATGEIQDVNRLRTVRRDIARVKTVLTEKQKQEASKKDGN